MSKLTLEDLGLTREELCERVVHRLCANFSEYADMESHLEQKIRDAADAAVARLADEHVLPNVNEFIENLTLQKTNCWGESQGKSLTFVEYLVERAEAYMKETVNYEGKPKGTDSYSWTGKGTRLAYMIDKHLHFSIEKAMKEALETANKSIVDGLEQTVKIKLEEIAKSLKVTVKT